MMRRIAMPDDPERYGELAHALWRTHMALQSEFSRLAAAVSRVSEGADLSEMYLAELMKIISHESELLESIEVLAMRARADESNHREASVGESVVALVAAAAASGVIGNRVDAAVVAIVDVIRQSLRRSDSDAIGI
jgi:hypothetical protein